MTPPVILFFCPNSTCKDLHLPPIWIIFVENVERRMRLKIRSKVVTMQQVETNSPALIFHPLLLSLR